MQDSQAPTRRGRALLRRTARAVMAFSLAVSVTGRRQIKSDAGYNFAVRHEHVFRLDKDTGEKLLNKFIFSINSTPTRLRGVSPHTDGLDLSNGAVTVGGEGKTTGIPGLPLPLGVATSGGLLAGADFEGHRLRFAPTSFSFVEHMNRSTETNNFSFAAIGSFQTGPPFTEEAAGTFGILSRTFKRRQDLGSSRQIQLSVSFVF